jgi:hypothetical protein
VAQIVEAGPDREKDRVVRWRRIDLKRVIAERFSRYLGHRWQKEQASSSPPLETLDQKATSSPRC